MAERSDPTTFLAPAEMRLHRALLRPRLWAILSLVVLAGLGWLYLGLMVGASLRNGYAVDAGMGLFEALCRPTFAGASHAGMPAGSVADLGLIFLMWAAMVFAMMLPTAGAMIVTYAEIAETAADKQEAAVSPLVLTAGYAAVWLGFAIAATALQAVLTRLALLDGGLATASALFSGAIFIGAGAYQFSDLKHACVTLCQRPFPFFLANWSTERGEIFRLGVRQGVYCVGCCWAMMLVMFAVGMMNVVWMAVLGGIMGVEKIMSTTRFSRAVGAVLIAVGIGFIVSSVVAHWPARVA
jgi:predicted metal-binding membrane protein